MKNGFGKHKQFDNIKTRVCEMILQNQGREICQLYDGSISFSFKITFLTVIFFIYTYCCELLLYFNAKYSNTYYVQYFILASLIVIFH